MRIHGRKGAAAGEDKLTGCAAKIADGRLLAVGEAGDVNVQQRTLQWPHQGA
jgi:hypothetical protein